MNSKIIYRETKRDLKIEIIPNPKGIVKFGYVFFYTIPFAIFLILGVYIFFDKPSKFLDFDSDTFYIIVIILVSVFLICFFIRRIFQIEILYITHSTLTLSKRFIFETNRRIFRIDQISDLKIAEKENYTKHPMSTQGFDYLGIETGEKEIQYLIEKGSLSFFYSGATVRFGKNIYNEDCQEILDRIKKYISLAS